MIVPNTAAPAATPASPAASATPPAQPSASSPAAAAAPVPGSSAATPSGAPSAEQASLLSGPSAALEIPDKFKVVKTDGTIDHEATLQKALGSIVHLEKRLGTGDLPPEKEDGYKLDYKAFPEGVKLNADGEKAFLKRAHGKGLTNAQVQFVIDEYAGALKQGLELHKQEEGSRTKSMYKDVNTELSTAWGEQYDANVRAANRGFNHLADAADKADVAKVGVDMKATYRILMKFLAKVGAGIAEDRDPTGGMGGIVDADLETLKKSEAYLDPNHKEHAATVAKVTALYERKFPKK